MELIRGKQNFFDDLRILAFLANNKPDCIGFTENKNGSNG